MRKKGHKSSGNLISVLGFGAIPNKQSVDCPDRYTACKYAFVYTNALLASMYGTGQAGKM